MGRFKDDLTTEIPVAEVIRLLQHYSGDGLEETITWLCSALINADDKDKPIARYKEDPSHADGRTWLLRSCHIPPGKLSAYLGKVLDTGWEGVLVTDAECHTEDGDGVTYGRTEAPIQFSKFSLEKRELDRLLAPLGVPSINTLLANHPSEIDPESPKTNPLPRQRHQENEIKRVISELGYQLLALPANTKGKEGVKREVRNRLNFTPGVFNKAWERLSDCKEIRYKNED